MVGADRLRASFWSRLGGRIRSASVAIVILLGLVQHIAIAQASEEQQSPEDRALLAHLIELNKELRALNAEIKLLRSTVAALAATQSSSNLPPPIVSSEIELGDSFVLGDQNATVAVIDFTDFQCPFCKRAYDQTFSQLRAKYIDTGKLKYAVRDFPLSFHGQAHGAAVAARCAGEQSAYWSMRDRLFSSQNRLGPQLYSELSDELGLDQGEFLACLRSLETADLVTADLSYGERVGVRGTPSFFIGRVEGDRIVRARRLSGAQSFASFASIIEPLLE